MKTSLLLIFSALCALATVSNVSVSPSSGSGTTQQFQFAYTSTNGPSDLSLLIASFSTSAPGLQSGPCRVQSAAQTGVIQLYMDDGSVISGGLGASGTLTNGHCTVDLAASWQYATGTQAWFAPAMTFNYSPVNIYGNIQDSHGANAGWAVLGSWSLSGGSGTITPTSVSPSSGTGATQQFTLSYNSTGGVSNVGLMMASFGASGGGTCRLQSGAQTGLVQLYLADGVNTTSGYLGTSATLANGACTINLAASWQYGTGNTVQFSPAMSFTGGGSISVFGNAMTVGGSTGSWVNLGGWTVPNNLPYTKTDASALQLPTTDIGQTSTIDALTGQPVLIPTSDHLPASISFMAGSVDWPDTLNMGDAFTVVIRNAKPNTQVWLLQINMQHLISPEPCVTAPTVESCYLTIYPVLPNQGLLGTTDGNGYFAYSSNVPGAGGFWALNFWVVNSGTPPASSATFETSDTSANFLGAVSYFAAGQSNISVPVYQ